MENITLFIQNFFSGFAETVYINLIKDDRWKLIIDGLKNTIIIALFAVVIGVVIGIVVAIIKTTNHYTGKLKFLNSLCSLYLTIIRGTPIMVQLLIMNYAVFKAASLDMGIYVAILAFGINSGAYVAEIIRAGIMSVDIGQTEAGRSLGLSSAATMRIIVLPQAIKNVLPAIFNEFIVLLKETSVAGYIAIRDLTRASDSIRTRTYSTFPLFVAAGIYLVMVVMLTKVQDKLERRLREGDRR